MSIRTGSETRSSPLPKEGFGIESAHETFRCSLQWNTLRINIRVFELNPGVRIKPVFEPKLICLSVLVAEP